MTKHVIYKGKNLPVLVTYYSLFKTQELSGKPLDENSTFSEFETLFYYALMEGHDYEEIEFTISQQKAGLILGAVFNQFKDLIPGFMAEISGKSGETEETKKK